MRKIKLSTWAKEHDLQYLAAYRMAKAGKLPIETLPSGSIRVLEENLESNSSEEKVAIYCRVSNAAQKNTTLQSQKERLLAYCAAKGYKVSRIVQETGSGLNDSRKQWLALLADNSITKIVVEHEDRFCRFGFNSYKKLLNAYGRDIEVINEVENDEQDIMQDFISIITSFCSRIYGSRRSKRKTEKIIEQLNQEV